MNKKKKLKFKNPFQKMKNYIKENGVWHFIWAVFLSIAIVGASACLIFALYIIISAPNFEKDLLYKQDATKIYYVDGSEMVRIGRENRQTVSYEDLPQVYIDAVLATEDNRFFQHNGLDIARFLKASLIQLTGRNEGGASTLTMQLVKNTYTDKTSEGLAGIIRKFTDIYMAVFKIENSYTKEEIFEFYVNTLYLGSGSTYYEGIYGVEMASQYYFGKSISEVSLAEASILAGLYQNSSLYNPYIYPENCRDRQKVVLRLMVNHGYITEEEMNDVLAIPIESLLADTTHTGATEVEENRAVIDYILSEVEDKTGKNPYRVPMEIYTTIDKKVQNTLNVMETGAYIRRGQGWYDDKDQEGVAITSVENGSIVALSGGRDYQAKGLNRATVRRQPGSTAKPMFDYAPMIEYLNASTGTYFFDEPYTYTNGTSITNADNGYQGMITLRQALIGSRNIPALQAFQRVMNQNAGLIPDLVHKFGIDYGSSLYESASIGGFEGISPIEMSAAYAVFGREGYYIEPYVFTKVIFEDDSTYEHKVTKERIISAETAYMITNVLIDVAKSEFGIPSVNVSGTQIGSKTGTTTIDNDSVIKLGVPWGTIPDSWSVSFSPEYAIALWYGYDKITKDYHMDTNQGWSARNDLMVNLAMRIYSTNKTFKMPSGVKAVEVEKYTYPLQLASEYTPANMRMVELFKDGTEPTDVSIRYARLEAPKNGNYTLSGNKVTLTWDEIDLPDAIDSSYLQSYFNENYDRFASKYYEQRISSNNNDLGSQGYEVYIQNSDGTLSDLGWFSQNKYSQTLEAGKTYTFVIKSAYSIFKDNASSGLTITVKTKNIDPEPDKPDKPDKPEDPEKPDKPDNTTKPDNGVVDNNDDNNNNNTTTNTNTGLD